MSGDRELVQRHFAKLLEEARARGMPDDVIGRMVLNEVVELWKAQRSIEDIAGQLKFVADNLDPDLEYEFMRP